MLKLYGGARSRATIVRWYLEELSIPYEFVLLDMQAGEHLQPEYLAINPFGKVPGIEYGDFHLWESGAILLYLSEKYAQVSLAREQRAEMTQWVIFANATLGPGIFVEASREREMPRLLGALNQILEHQSYLVGDQLTVADVAVGSMLWYIPFLLKLELSEYPAIVEYTQRLSARPAFKKAFAGR